MPVKRYPIAWCSFGGYLRWTPAWWSNLLQYITGILIHVRPSSLPRPRVELRAPGWWKDVYTIYHRARYGWAPRDVWNLDDYLNRVFAQTLPHLADTTHGAPGGYPFTTIGKAPVDDTGAPVTNFEQWSADLRRWGAAFTPEPDIQSADWEQWEKDRKRRVRLRTQALHELAIWWEALWD